MSYKIDHRIRTKPNDIVSHIHDYNLDLVSNHIYLMGEETYGEIFESVEPGVEYILANRFIRNLNLCMRVNPDKPIVVHMKTCGGDWNEGMAIYDCIKACPNPVTIINYTHARSMSSIIFQAANKRVMMPHSYFLFHDGILSVDGTNKQVYASVEYNKIADAQMIDIYVEAMGRTGVKPAEAKKWLRAQLDKKEDVYLLPPDAIKYGFADEIFDNNWAKLTEYTEEQLSR